MGWNTAREVASIAFRAADLGNIIRDIKSTVRSFWIARDDQKDLWL